MKIAVVGLGKIGLPLAVQFAGQGHTVVGADINPALVSLVNEGSEPFPGEADLRNRLAQVVGSGLLSAVTDTSEAVRGADAVVVVVPLFVTDEDIPDFEAMDSATREIGRGLAAGTLVSYETTLPVGTTRERLTPILETVSGMRAGRDFHVAFSPERVLTGRVFADLKRYPKLVGGIDQASEEAAQAFYSSVLEFEERNDLARPNGVWRMGSAEAAELAKLAETTYRDVNIGLANQFSDFAMKHGIDFLNVIEACNSQPFSHLHRPGIAVGGHCIPVYPRLYLWNDSSATVVRAAREANTSAPARAVARLEVELGSLVGVKVAVLGAAYRGGVKETAYSGVFPLVAELSRRGADPLVHDPLYTPEELEFLGLAPYTPGDEVDSVMLQADHAEYAEWGIAQTPGARVVIDGRACLTRANWTGATLIVLGAG